MIEKHIPVSESLISIDDAVKYYNLDKIPGELPEQVRIIHVGSYDACPCIGAHVSNTSEIGRFLITTCSFDNGVLRIRYKLNSI